MKTILALFLTTSVYAACPEFSGTFVRGGMFGAEYFFMTQKECKSLTTFSSSYSYVSSSWYNTSECATVLNLDNVLADGILRPNEGIFSESDLMIQTNPRNGVKAMLVCGDQGSCYILDMTTAPNSPNSETPNPPTCR